MHCVSGNDGEENILFDQMLLVSLTVTVLNVSSASREWPKTVHRFHTVF